MKKMIAVLLALVMLLALAGCSDSSTDSIVGTWEATVNSTAILDQLMEGMDEELQSYFELGEFTYTMNITFRDDGTYATAMDEASVVAAVDSLVASLEEGMIKAMEAQFAEMGIDMTVEEALAATGMTIADLMTGIDAETIVAELTTGTEGNYKAEEGKLYLSASLETTVDETIYDTFTLDGDKLTLTEHFGSEDDQTFAAEMYPMVFTRK